MRVLIVDDHQLFAEAVCSLLQRQGADVVAIAGTSRDALEAMEKVDNVDVVLMDLGLPDGDGISTAPGYWRGGRVQGSLPLRQRPIPRPCPTPSQQGSTAI